MPKKRPPYLIRRTGRQGEALWYYWKRPDPQIRIRGEYGTREFWGNYEAASHRHPPSIQKPPETLAWLIDRYRESAAWRSLADGTRRVRDRFLHQAATKNPDLKYADVDRALIVQTRDSKQDTPASANNFLDTVRGLFNWAVDAGLLKNSPVAGVKGLRLSKTGGFRQWTEEDIAAFRQKWPVGSRERLALEILLNTGLRRGDAARLGRQHIRNGRLRITTQKTGTLIDIPIGKHLEKIIAASPTGDLALVAVQKTGKAMTNGSFGNWFQKAAEAAGVKGNAHGLRKAAAVRLAEAGSTIPEMNAVFGWEGSRMAMHYIDKASRQTLADNAAARLDRNVKEKGSK